MIKTIKTIKTRITTSVLLILMIGLGAEAHLLFTAESGIRLIPIAALLAIQLVAAVSDLHTGLIPLWLVFSSLLVGTLVICICEGSSTIKEHILGGVLSFFIFAFFVIVTKGQIGGGDLLLLTVTGFFTGASMVPGILFLSIVLTGLFSVFLLVLKKSSIRAEIPYAPFILLATAVLTF